MKFLRDNLAKITDDIYGEELCFCSLFVPFLLQGFFLSDLFMLKGVRILLEVFQAVDHVLSFGFCWQYFCVDCFRCLFPSSCFFFKDCFRAQWGQVARLAFFMPTFSNLTYFELVGNKNLLIFFFLLPTTLQYAKFEKVGIKMPNWHPSVGASVGPSVMRSLAHS